MRVEIDHTVPLRTALQRALPSNVESGCAFAPQRAPWPSLAAPSKVGSPKPFKELQIKNQGTEALANPLSGAKVKALAGGEKMR